MTLKLGDYVRIQLHKNCLSDPDMFIYGIIKGFEGGGQVVNVDLSEPFWGVPTATAMMYMIKHLTKLEYTLATTKIKDVDESLQCMLETHNMKCDHNWIQSGRSFLTDKKWYDCKICGEQKGG